METSKKNRRKFDRQFKVDAVRLLAESGKPVTEVARDLGVRDTVLHRWKRELAPGPDGKPSAGPLGKTPEQRELEDLKKKLAQVEEEREILKKAMAVFSRRPG
jgi:transposase-like protein